MDMEWNMINRIVRLSLVLITVFLAGCNTDSSGGTEVVLNEVGNIEGVISDVGNANPLFGVTVSVGSQSVITNSSGVYTLTGVNIGSRTISVSLNDYSSFSGVVLVNKGTTVTFNISMSPVNTALGNNYSGVSNNVASDLVWNSGRWTENNWK